MKLGFSTLGCPDWSVAEIADYAARYEFDGVELRCHTDGNHVSPEAAAGDIAAVKDAFDDAGARVFSVSAYARFTSPEADERAKNLDEAKKAIDVAAALGAGFVRFFAGRLAEGTSMDEGIGCAAECLRESARHGESA